VHHAFNGEPAAQLPKADSIVALAAVSMVEGRGGVAAIVHHSVARSSLLLLVDEPPPPPQNAFTHS
jgi:hypothetical protein